MTKSWFEPYGIFTEVFLPMTTRWILPTLMLVVFTFTSVPVWAQTDGNQQSTIDVVKSRFETGHVFEAEFEHRFVDSFTQDTTRQSGQIWVADQGYKVETSAQILLVDGMTSRSFDRYKNRLIISKYDPQDDDFAPSKILNGLDSTYSVARDVFEGGFRIIQLSSNDPFATFKMVEVQTNESYLPLKITAVDQTDNEYITEFNSGSFIPHRDALFTLDLPENVERVDLRKQ
jgi:outer membrane lipoprotein-sorting protein